MIPTVASPDTHLTVQAMGLFPDRVLTINNMEACSLAIYGLIDTGKEYLVQFARYRKLEEVPKLSASQYLGIGKFFIYVLNVEERK